MKRSLFVLVALSLSCATLAAPAPDPFKSGWSYPVDPDGDCKIGRDSGVLTIEMPGTDHDYDPFRERLNAPRLFRDRDLEGDFVMQVRVRIEESDLFTRVLRAVPTMVDGGTLPANLAKSRYRNDFCPSARSTVKGQPSYVSAGFLIIPPDAFATNCIRIEYRVSRRGNEAGDCVVHLDRTVGGGQFTSTRDKHSSSDMHHADWPFKSKPNYVYLRLVRKNWSLHGETTQDDKSVQSESGSLHCEISPDGKSWASMGGRMYGELPPKLKVGLAAYSTSSEPCKVRFDQFRLTRVQKKQR